VADGGEGAFGPHVRVPFVTTPRGAGTTVHAVLVGLGRTGLEPDRAPRVVVEGTDRVRVTLSSGVSRTVALPGPAREPVTAPCTMPATSGLPTKTNMMSRGRVTRKTPPMTRE